MFGQLGEISAPHLRVRGLAAAVVFAGMGLVFASVLLNERPQRTAATVTLVAHPSKVPATMAVAVSAIAPMHRVDRRKHSPARARTRVRTRARTSGSQQGQGSSQQLVRRAWMVETGEWLDRLNSGSFWRQQQGGSSGRPRRRRSNGNGGGGAQPRRMSLGRFLGSQNYGRNRNNSSGNQNYSSGNNGSQQTDQQDPGAGSEFYSGDGDTYKTVCVRACDGYFSPVSFSTTRDRFDHDQRICESRCGGGKLYVFKNPGGSPEDMVDLEGNSYSELKTAFLFKTTYISACTCKPHPWQQASRDRHKVYALKAAIKAARGKQRRMARAALRRFKRKMRQHRSLASLQTGIPGRTGSDAVPTSSADGFSGGQFLTAAQMARLETERVASFSPIRSLPTAVVPGQSERAIALERVALLVTPVNDGEEIFLPVRNPIRVLSQLSRPAIRLAMAATAPGNGEAQGAAQPGTAQQPAGAGQQGAGQWVRAVNDDTRVMLPVRNPIRVLSRLSRPAIRLAMAATAPGNGEAQGAAQPGTAQQPAGAGQQGAGQWVRVVNDDTRVMLPTRNPTSHQAQLRPGLRSAAAATSTTAKVLAGSRPASRPGQGIWVVADDDARIMLPTRNPLRLALRLGSATRSRVNLNSSTAVLPDSRQLVIARRHRHRRRHHTAMNRVVSSISTRRPTGRGRAIKTQRRQRSASLQRSGVMRLGSSRPRSKTSRRSVARRPAKRQNRPVRFRHHRASDWRQAVFEMGN